MRLHLKSAAGVVALFLSTTVTAQGIIQKPVTGADRKKAQATTKAPATDAAPATTDSSTTAAQPTVQKAAPVGKAQTQTTTPTTTSTQPDTTAPDEPATPQSTAPGQTGTTPGQAQTTPGEASQLTPAQTGTTPSGQSVPNATATDQAQAPKVTAVTKEDVKTGVSVYDQKGGVVGKIVSTSAKGAVVDTGTIKATIPTSSFAKGDKGLVISMTKAEIDAAAKPATKTTKKPK
jgi:hypothetical protein